MVLATNIAETSLTIEDVVYVVDTGKLKARLAHLALLERMTACTGYVSCHVHDGGFGLGSVCRYTGKLEARLVHAALHEDCGVHWSASARCAS